MSASITSPGCSIFPFLSRREKGTGDGLGQEPQSPLPIRYFWRAMIANMDAWVRSDTLPPPSNYPKIADGNLVPLEKYALPAIPGVNRPHEASQAYRLDFGPNWQQGILSIQPPKVGPAFPVLVPQVDADGNERDGVRLPEITVPLATYTGWNLRDPSIGAPDQRVSFEASYLPFPKTAADRQKTGDPRKSIAERYARSRGLSRAVHEGSGRSGGATLDSARRPRSVAPSRGAGMDRKHEVKDWRVKMRSKAALIVLLMGVQAAYAFDSVPMGEYHQRRVKLAAELHGGSAVIFAAHEPLAEYQEFRQDEDFYYLTGSTSRAERCW